MNIFFFTLALVATALIAHLVIWRVRLPKKQVAMLLKIFLFTLAAGVFFMFRYPRFIEWNMIPAGSVFEIIQSILLFLSLAAFYIVSYPAIEADSPTLVIIKAVSDAGPGGLKEEKLKSMLNDDILIAPRVKDMLADNMIYSDGKKYMLTHKGVVMVRIVRLYRDLLKLAKGG